MVLIQVISSPHLYSFSGRYSPSSSPPQLLTTHKFLTFKSTNLLQLQIRNPVHYLFKLFLYPARRATVARAKLSGGSS